MPKRTLKAALLSQQSRLKPKPNVNNVAKTKGKRKASPSVIPFHPTDRILLVGEGNFSFARSLFLDPPPQLQSFPPTNVTATTLDTEEECYAKYPDAEHIVQFLRDKGIQVLFQVDATRLEKCPALKNRRWDRVVWNFPHAGKGIADQDRNVLSNQLLLLGFLRSAANILTAGRTPSVHIPQKRKRDNDDDDQGSEHEQEPYYLLGSPGTRGTVLITLRNVAPYTLWDLPRLAKKPPDSTPRYILLRSFAFHRSAWRGYEHCMTKGERAHGEGKTGDEDRTWEFCLHESSNN